MHDFGSLLLFSALPLATALLFALALPPLGAALHLRNESLLGIALPPAGSALLALATAFGWSGEGGVASFAIIAAGLAILAALLPPGSGPRRANPRVRSLVLAAVFCAGNASLLLVLALSPLAQARLFHAMNGEMLAVGSPALVATVLAALFTLLLFLRYRGFVFAYLLDEETLRVRTARHRLTGVVFMAAAVAAITGAVLLIGPILCAGLLILPPLLAERRARGLARYLVASAAIGAGGTFLGFVGALLLDWPPAPAAVAGLIIVGGLRRVLPDRA
jgi:ABC-type Mn2+/Zn2+ transport system permease subunit